MPGAGRQRKLLTIKLAQTLSSSKLHMGEGVRVSSVNMHTKEICIKVVYYGPGLGGKTSSLQALHRVLRPELRGNLSSLATGEDRTLFFDFLPVTLPKVRDFTIRMMLYTVPGQVHYNATRQLVLQGCDGVIFVADSQTPRRGANIESRLNLEYNLREHGLSLPEHPLVFQHNKRDLADIMPLKTMDEDLNMWGLPSFESCAASGVGVEDALKALTKLMLVSLTGKGVIPSGAQASTD
jgi:signal recognition particle receptor subunit beta